LAEADRYCSDGSAAKRPSQQIHREENVQVTPSDQDLTRRVLVRQVHRDTKPDLVASAGGVEPVVAARRAAEPRWDDLGPTPQNATGSLTCSFYVRSMVPCRVPGDQHEPGLGPAG